MTLCRYKLAPSRIFENGSFHSREVERERIFGLNSKWQGRMTDSINPRRRAFNVHVLFGFAPLYLGTNIEDDQTKM